MSSPYVFSKSKHVRTQNPPKFDDYKKYKPYLRDEFSRQCVYCRHGEFGNPGNFGADHYRPRKLFPLLAAEYLNLYYCCNRCNSFKGTHWPDSAAFKAGQFIPNPCEHVMFQHMRFRGAEVEGRSITGNWTIERLDLNDPDIVAWRETVIQSANAIAERLAQAWKTLKQLKKVPKVGMSTDEFAELNQAILQAETNAAKMRDSLIQLGVEV